LDFTEYVAARRASLVRSAVLLGCRQPDAEDLVQAALLRCFRHWRRVERRSASPNRADILGSPSLPRS
jgi:DNA-directed RNA polymerase specialized sigma24 family protein